MGILRFVPLGGVWISCHHYLAEVINWRNSGIAGWPKLSQKFLKGGDVYRC